MKKLSIFFSIITLVLMTTHPVQAANRTNKKTYLEMEFIQTFKGKDKKFILNELGEPARKEIPIKPSTAESMIGSISPDDVKKDSIEMWYYLDLVKYNSKETFKKTEVTFINNKCTNITFVNK